MQLKTLQNTRYSWLIAVFIFHSPIKKLTVFFSISHYKRNYERKFINQLLDNLVIKSFLP